MAKAESDLTFSMALVRFKKGDEIARTSWEKGFHLIADEGEIYKVEPNGEREVYKATNEDILAEDWEVTKEAE